VKRDGAATAGAETLYLIVTGGGAARRVPGLLPALTERFARVITVPTPAAQRIVSMRELAAVPGHHLAEGYFDPVIYPTPQGDVLVAPCTFNSLNKLAQGIADTLALSIVAEAIGRGRRVTVAVGVNAALWAHPRAQESAATLRRWGCVVLDPVVDPERDGEQLTMAPDDAILAALTRTDKE
jgi:phosphopantothenoylcysteine synthetase/decarboxylase